MKNIRSSLFETNSSSSHSLSVAEGNEGILDTIIPDKDGRIIIHGGQFGRDYIAYNDSITKASYCATDNQDNYDNLIILASVIKEHTGCIDVAFDFGEWSYIDHESIGLTKSLFTNRDELRRFLFNSGSWLFIADDSGQEPPNFYDIGKNLEYTHQLEIDGTEMVYKFVGEPNSEELSTAINSVMEYHPMNGKSGYGFIEECPENEEEMEAYWERKRKWEEEVCEYIYDWGHQNVDGGEFSSLMDMDKGMIYLYNVDHIYDNSVHAKFLGYKILNKQTLKFRVIKI